MGQCGDAAGQGAAARFYEWEQAHAVEVSVARLPQGKDPGDLAQSDPESLQRAVDTAMPFLGFRLQRTLNARSLDSPEHRARLAEEAMAVVNEHPNAKVRKLYAGEVATKVGERYRYEWEAADGSQRFGFEGELLESAAS